MQPERFDLSAEPVAPTMPLRESLGEITGGLDSRFMLVGATLTRAIETIDRIVQGLDSIGQAINQGAGANGVESLTRVARELGEVSDQEAARSGELGLIRAVSHRLGQQVGEIEQALFALQLYSFNIKVAASGAADFVDFADHMRGELASGMELVEGFGVKLGELDDALASVRHSGQLLLQECAKVIPRIPDQLVAGAGQLQRCQTSLARIAGQTLELARAIQGNVAAILGAIQIGDITRQRLEHVNQACGLLDERSAQIDGPVGGAMRYHVLALLRAQLEDTAEDFAREMDKLIASLHALAPQAEQLLNLREGEDCLAASQVALAELEVSIAGASAVTRQLRETDRQARKIVRLVLETIEDVTERAEKVGDLKLAVEHMAINIALRCRRDAAISRPVAVVADEVRALSEKLGEATTRIVGEARALSSSAIGQADASQAADAGGDDALGELVEAIGEAVSRSETAMTAAGSEAHEIVGMLRDTGEQLGSTLGLSEVVLSLGSALAELGGPDPGEAAIGEADTALRALLTEIGASYSMAQERQVHNRFLLPGMEPVGSPTQLVGSGDDDLFDDGLF